MQREDWMPSAGLRDVLAAWCAAFLIVVTISLMA
jgi:hypothetical protein